MGSSPVTATILADFMDLCHHLETFFREQAPLAAPVPGEGLVIAFSGGPDSAALLLAASRLQGWPVVAAHLDHGLDPGSAGRAAEAARTAGRLGVPFVAGRREVASLRLPGESPEAAARRIRYAFLDEVRRAHGARWVATAHHRDDQAETVLLRLLFGSGLEGLAGIRPVQGTVVRPFLDLPRAALRAAVEGAGLAVVEDPTNFDLRVPRNRVRHGVLPSLEPMQSLSALLSRLASRTRGAMATLDRRLGEILQLEALEDGVAASREAVERLPAELMPFALAALHRRAGAPYPAGSAARAELVRQLAGPAGRLGCDGGDGWRWESAGERLTLRRAAPEEKPVFSYTLEIPGELPIPELGVRIGLCRRPVEPWMFRGSPHCAALALPLAPGDRVTVRNRRPGDRLHPLGAAGSRRLKEVLIDRRMPRHERDRLPLLCVGGRIAWVPGVTIDERFRLGGQTDAWVATVQSLDAVPTSTVRGETR